MTTLVDSKPKIVLVLFGKPGSGKTHLSLRLAKDLALFRISTDETRQELFETPNFDRAETESLWEELYGRIGELLAAGNSVIIDGNMGKVSHRILLRKRCEQRSVRFVSVHLHCDDGVALKRLNGRTPLHNPLSCDKAAFAARTADIDEGNEVGVLQFENSSNNSARFHANYSRLLDALRTIGLNPRGRDRPSFLLLDFAQTIVKYVPSSLDIAFEVLSGIGRVANRSEFGRVIFETSCLLAAKGFRSGMETEERFWGAVISRLLNRSPDTCTEMATNLTRRIRESRQNARDLCIDFDTLEAITASGIQMGIISNWKATLPRYCQELGIARYFRFVLASEAVGCAKPQSGIYIKGLLLSGHLLRDVLYVGDNLLFDYVYPEKLGFRTLLIDEAGWYSDFEVRRLQRFHDLRARLNV